MSKGKRLSILTEAEMEELMAGPTSLIPNMVTELDLRQHEMGRSQCFIGVV